MEVEGGSLVQDHPLMYSKFEVSLGYRRPCLKNRPKKKKNPIDSSWPEITLESDKLSKLHGFRHLWGSTCHRAQISTPATSSNHLACVVFEQWPVAVPGAQREVWGLCQYLFSENLLGTPLLT